MDAPLALATAAAAAAALLPPCSASRLHPTLAAHPLPDVRQRALRSLQFKLQHGLLDAASLAADALPAAAERLLSFLLQPGGAATADDAVTALELLAVLARQPGAAAQLLQLGADHELIRVADELPGCTQLASALLGELLCSAAAEPAASAAAAASAGAAVDTWPLDSTPRPQLWHPPTAAPQPSPWASPPSLPASSSVAAPDAAAASSPSTLWPAAVASALAAGSRRVKAVQLSEDDSQLLFEVALELQSERAEAAGEAALLATLATLLHGVLADMPAAAVAGEPALLHALLRLVDGAQGRPAVAASALSVLQALAEALAAAEPAAEGEVGLALAPLAHECLLRCAALLRDGGLQPQALATAQALLPLLELPADTGLGGGTSSSSSSSSWLAPLVAALTEALRLNLVSRMRTSDIVALSHLLHCCGDCWLRCRLPCVHDACPCATPLDPTHLQLSECTAAGVAPPDSWATGFHALVLGPSTLGILQLIQGLVQSRPRLLSSQVG